MRTMQKTLPWVCLLLVGIAYLLQLPTPLRVNTDGVTYLTLAASYNDGHGFIWHNHVAHFPSGYPFIVAKLERMGLGTSMGLVGENLVCLAISVAIGIWLLRRAFGLSQQAALWVAVLWMMSWGAIRFATIPGSEMSYLAVSFICLMLLHLAETTDQPRAWLFLCLAIVLVPIAMKIRTVGIVLLPAIAWSLVLMLWNRRGEPRLTFEQWVHRWKKELIIAAGIAIILSGLLLFAISRTAYFKEGIAVMTSHGILHELLFTIQQRCLEAISLMLNIRTNRSSLIHAILILAGGVSLAAILVLIARRFSKPTSLDIYVACYVCVLLIWPYREDVRFWLPIQIFVYGLIARELSPHLIRFPIKAACTLWITAFTAMGIVAFIRSTRLSYSGDRFSELYELPFFRDTYRAASHNGLPVDPKNVNDELLPLLKRFGSRDFSK